MIIAATFIIAAWFFKSINTRRENLERNNSIHDYEPPPGRNTTQGDHTIENDTPVFDDDITLVGNICYATPSMRRHGGGASHNASRHSDEYDDVIPPSQQRKETSPGYENVDPSTGLPTTLTPHLNSPTNKTVMSLREVQVQQQALHDKDDCL